jgi:NAD-dependent deacetylase
MDELIAACRRAREGNVIALTGAGVSAESGIPTFRGKDGYWTIGAREYHPQELATHAAFVAMPWDVWSWYLYRRGVCRRAQPNPAHAALVRLDAALGDRFALVTQNVDGLHRRAGSPEARTFPIHGDIDQMRCAVDCVATRWPIPDAVETPDKGTSISDSSRALLRCPSCGGMARPHVLWFDESYDEPRFFLDTVRDVSTRAALVIVAGTSAQTNLPWQVVTIASRAGATIVDINTEANPFGDVAHAVARISAATALPQLVDAMISPDFRR